MPKHKPPRHSPTIDMTAMCDVSFLLLTFFMLTAKAKPQEPVVVDTPSSISETKLPESGTLTILVDKEGKVFLDMTGQHTRYALISSMNEQYQLGLTEEEKKKFSIFGAFGVPRKDLRKWLAMNSTERQNAANFPGIPSDTVGNELGPWIHNARLAQFRLKQEGIVPEEYVIVIKADKDTPYPAIQKVLNTLSDINVNKFNLITNLEADPNKLQGL
ncbi:MAG: biopolymer transporter ExbD [Saprospiraceae bacterium]|nr:biopolymer transporter ExbD [Saprospiraceae bacterium]MDW8484607.1 biopolymer transporter ExbD [Saprospiraceae bacterium]